MRRIKMVAAVLTLAAILTGVFTSLAFAADPTADNGLPACCQQQQGQAAQGCCGQQGTTTGYQGAARGGCCGR